MKKSHVALCSTITSKIHENQDRDCDYVDFKEKKCSSFITSWGPVGFKKDNHPLALMVNIESMWITVFAILS